MYIHIYIYIFGKREAYVFFSLHVENKMIECALVFTCKAAHPKATNLPWYGFSLLRKQLQVCAI